MWIGNQQFTSRNITIRDASIAGIYLNWDWVWTFIGLNIYRTPVAIDMGGMVGSLVVLDSTFSGITEAVFRSNAYNEASGWNNNSMILDNVSYFKDLPSSTSVIVADGPVPLLTASTPKTTLSYAQGHVFASSGAVQPMQGLFTPVTRPAVLTRPNGDFVGRSRPKFSQDTMINVSASGIIGDGVTDVTGKLQSLLYKAAGKGTLYFPSGTYILTDTLYIPPGTQMIGEVWPVLMVYFMFPNYIIAGKWYSF